MEDLITTLTSGNYSYNDDLILPEPASMSDLVLTVDGTGNISFNPYTTGSSIPASYPMTITTGATTGTTILTPGYIHSPYIPAYTTSPIIITSSGGGYEEMKRALETPEERISREMTNEIKE